MRMGRDCRYDVQLVGRKTEALAMKAARCIIAA